MQTTQTRFQQCIQFHLPAAADRKRANFAFASGGIHSSGESGAKGRGCEFFEYAFRLVVAKVFQYESLKKFMR